MSISRGPYNHFIIVIEYNSVEQNLIHNRNMREIFFLDDLCQHEQNVVARNI